MYSPHESDLAPIAMVFLFFAPYYVDNVLINLREQLPSSL